MRNKPPREKGRDAAAWVRTKSASGRSMGEVKGIIGLGKAHRTQGNSREGEGSRRIAHQGKPGERAGGFIVGEV